MLKVNDVSASHLPETLHGKDLRKCFLEVSYQFLETNQKCSLGFSSEGLHKIHCLIVLNTLLVPPLEDPDSTPNSSTSSPASPEERRIDFREHPGSPFRTA